MVLCDSTIQSLSCAPALHLKLKLGGSAVLDNSSELPCMKSSVLDRAIIKSALVGREEAPNRLFGSVSKQMANGGVAR